MWMLKVDSSSEFLLQQLFIFRDDTSRYFTNIISGFDQNCKLVFLANFFNRTFLLIVCDGLKDNIDFSPEILLQSVWMAWNQGVPQNGVAHCQPVGNQNKASYMFLNIKHKIC